MYISIDKYDSMHDDNLDIQVNGLKANCNYLIELRVVYDAGTFSSEGCYHADQDGVISLNRQAPSRGSYSGIRGMGLFESLEPCKDFRFGGYSTSTPPPNLTNKLILRDCNGRVLDEVTFTRRWLHPSVTREEISVDRIRGTLFKPPGDGPFPTILDMSGTGGGLHEHKSAALANQGFCVFALAYFAYKDLPEELSDVDMEYFLETINWLTSLSFTSSKVGLQGVSFGGMIVLVLPLLTSKISSVVTINGPHAFNEYAYIQHNGTKVPQASSDLTNLYFINNQLCYKGVIENMKIDESEQYKIEDSPKDVEYRFLVSEDDLSTSSILSARQQADKLSKTGHRVEVQMVPGGHLMEPPYFPAHPLVYSKFTSMNMAYGGETSLHGQSQVVSWAATVNFFKSTLGTPTQLATLNDWNSKL